MVMETRGKLGVEAAVRKRSVITWSLIGWKLHLPSHFDLQCSVRLDKAAILRQASPKQSPLVNVYQPGALTMASTSSPFACSRHPPSDWYKAPLPDP
jgi:hypothetical protein